jgi:fumarylacetoacetate (FAA) hydrolase
MKLATKRNGTRDGQLLVVARDLKTATAGAAIAPTLQQALENWRRVEDPLQDIYKRLNSGTQRDAFELDAFDLMAPLPRAYQWLDASAFHSHGDLLEKVFNLEPPPEKLSIPLMYQGGSDDFLGPRENIALPFEEDGIDFEAEVAVVVDDVPMASPTENTGKHIRLLMLVNDVSLRSFAVREMKTGFGFLQAKPSSSFSPVAITPDELESAWSNSRVDLRLEIFWNGAEFGHPSAGTMGFGFDQLIAHAARTRNLRPGTIIGSGTVSNYDYRQVGSACIAERRAIETLDHGAPYTQFMKFGDEVRITMKDATGFPIFGEIHQRVARYQSPGVI